MQLVGIVNVWGGKQGYLRISTNPHTWIYSWGRNRNIRAKPLDAHFNADFSEMNQFN